MARASKPGLDYFPHDCNMFEDSKIKYIRALYGVNGYAMYNRLLEILYSEQGYYLYFPERNLILFADDFKIEHEQCRKIIQSLIDENLFDRNLYEIYSILTSIRIQKTYILACDRRKKLEFDEKYLLISPKNYITEGSKCKIHINPINVNINSQNININSQNDNTGTQSKVNRNQIEMEMESKRNGEEMEMETEKISPPPISPLFSFTKPDLIEIQDEIHNINLNPESKKIPIANIEALANQYFEIREKYKDKDNGFWLTKKGQTIENWKDNLFTFIQYEDNYSKLINGNGNNGNGNTKQGNPGVDYEGMPGRYAEFASILANIK